MKMFKRKTAFLFLIIFLLGTFKAHSEEYDPQHTMLALNMAIVSVHKILTTHDRLILDQEYQNIIENLSVANINDDPEIMELYTKLLDITKDKKLREEELKLVKSRYNLEMQNRLSNALRDAAKNSGKVLKDTSKNPSITNIFLGIGRLLTACAASYFKYQASETNLRNNLKESSFLLKSDELESFNDIQKKLLSSSWSLMRKYHLPDEYRLGQKTMDDFYRAVEEPDTASRRLRMLKALEYDFNVYPPYWFYRARAAQEADDIQEAEKCFNKFDEVWRPVLKKDPYKLEVTKYRFSQLVKSDDENLKPELLNLLSEMRKNTLNDDWPNNLFAAAAYYSLGETGEAVDLLQNLNIDYGHEKELSSAMLYVIKNNVPPEKLAQDTLRALRLNKLLSKMPEEFKESALAIADYFDERENSVEHLKELHKEKSNPLIIHALRIIEIRKENPSAYKNIFELMNQQIASKDNIFIPYAGFLPLVKDYADNANISANIFLGDMYNYGWGVSANLDRAIRSYTKSASQGDIYSQNMFIHLNLANQRYSNVAVKVLSQNNQNNNKSEIQTNGKSAKENFDLGIRCYTRENYKEAIIWFDNAARQGHSGAEYMLGLMYENGFGIAKNLATARAWYREAAKKGHEGAKRDLERLGGTLEGSEDKEKSGWFGLW